MKPDIRNINSGSQRHTEGLDGAVEILVIQSVLVVPNPGSWIGDFVSDEPNAVVPRVGLDLV